MGLGPDVWGPHGWKFLHFVALGYPNNPSDIDKQNYKNFFTLVGDILPCSLCSNHYKENLIKYPINDKVLEDKINLLNWTIDIHNEVNLTNNKEQITYDKGLENLLSNFNIIQNKEKFTNNISSSNIPDNSDIKKLSKTNKKISWFTYFLLFLSIVIIITIIYYLRNNKKII